MGFFLTLLVIGALVGFNIFAVDALIKMRADVVAIRKTVSAVRGQGQAQAPPEGPPAQAKEA